MTSWNVVTDGDGKEWLEVSATLNTSEVMPGDSLVSFGEGVIGTFGGVPVVTDAAVPQGGMMFDGSMYTVASGTTPYTLDGLMRMRNQQWNQDYLKWPEPILPGDDRIIATRRQQRLEERGSHCDPLEGRFGNLDWDEAS